jgi:cAMP phosphodiesterase
MSVQELPVSHGTTTQGNYESSAFFIRISQHPSAPSAGVSEKGKEAEVLFFGDVESWQTGEDAERLNTRVWQVAAEKWASGTLRAIFVSCA